MLCNKNKMKYVFNQLCGRMYKKGNITVYEVHFQNIFEKFGSNRFRISLFILVVGNERDIE